MATPKRPRPVSQHPPSSDTDHHHPFAPSRSLPTLRPTFGAVAKPPPRNRPARPGLVRARRAVWSKHDLALLADVHVTAALVRATQQRAEHRAGDDPSLLHPCPRYQDHNNTNNSPLSQEQTPYMYLTTTTTHELSVPEQQRQQDLFTLGSSSTRLQPIANSIIHTPHHPTLVTMLTPSVSPRAESPPSPLDSRMHHGIPHHFAAPSHSPIPFASTSCSPGYRMCTSPLCLPEVDEAQSSTSSLSLSPTNNCTDKNLPNYGKSTAERTLVDDTSTPKVSCCPTCVLDTGCRHHLDISESPLESCDLLQVTEDLQGGPAHLSTIVPIPSIVDKSAIAITADYKSHSSVSSQLSTKLVTLSLQSSSGV